MGFKIRWFVLSPMITFMLFNLAQAHEGHADGEHPVFEWSDVLREPEAQPLLDPRQDYGQDHFIEDDFELHEGSTRFQPLACQAASASQKSQVNLGNTKKDSFLQQCASYTRSSPWCQQLVRPNPSSKATFSCTYGSNQVHQLIHPDERTWSYAYRAVGLVEDLQSQGVRVCQIYNWWRPEPYNANVGGAAGRHPLGTSVDVRFCTKADQEKAFRLLCQYRRAGRLRALGYYSSTSLHFGVGDNTANTWGKSCPNS